MLLIALSFFYVSWLLISAGWAFNQLSGFKKQREHLSDYATNYFTGLALGGLICLTFWIFIPLQITLHVPFIGLALASNLWWWKSKTKPLSSFKPTFSKEKVILGLSLFVFLLALCMKAAAPSSWFDHGLYYIQTMRWMQNYPMITGLANVHNRLGFASAFHALQALFSQKWIRGSSFDDLNELTLLWFVIGFTARVFYKQPKVDWFTLIILILVPFVAIEFLSSPSVDVLLMLITLIMVLESVESSPNYAFIWLLGAFGVACKLSGIIILVLPFVILWRHWPEQKWKTLAGAWVLPAAGIVVITKNIILTGYPFFTFPLFGLDVDWALPFDKVIQTNQEVIGHARIKLSHAEILKGTSYNLVADMKLSEWLPVWWAQRSLSHVLLLISLFISVCFWVFRLAKKQVQTTTDWLAVACVISLLYWFVTAPEPRFQFGLLLALPALTLSSILKQSNFQTSTLLLPSMLLLSACLFLVLARDKRVLANHLVEPAQWKTGRMAHYTISPGICIYHPLPEPGSVFASGQCWDADLPCAPYRIDWLEGRGNKIQDGFRIRKNNASK